MDGQIGADAHRGPKVSIHLGSGEAKVDVWVATVGGGWWGFLDERASAAGGCQMVVVGEVDGWVEVGIGITVSLPSLGSASLLLQARPSCLSLNAEDAVLIPSPIIICDENRTLAFFSLLPHLLVCLSVCLSGLILPLPRPCLIPLSPVNLPGLYLPRPRV